MKKLFIFANFLLFMMLAQVVQSQKLDDVISRHVETMGGREKIMSLTTARLSGAFATPGASVISIVVTKKHMAGSRIDIDIDGVNNYQVITPQKGIIFTPVQGDKEPRPLVEDQYKIGQVQLDLHGPFVNHSEKGIKIELAGKDTVNGSVCDKLKVTSPNGNVMIYSIDRKTNFIVKTNTKVFQYGALEDYVTIYSDYRKTADGYWFAYNTLSPRGETKYVKIETNVEVDKDIFKIK